MAFFEAERDIIAMQLAQRLEAIRERVVIDREPVRSWESCSTGHKQGPASPPRSGWLSASGAWAGGTWRSIP